MKGVSEAGGGQVFFDRLCLGAVGVRIFGDLGCQVPDLVGEPLRNLEGFPTCRVRTCAGGC